MTPGYAIKHWWRACCGSGESLKAFARRFLGERGGRVTTASAWFMRKRRK